MNNFISLEDILNSTKGHLISHKYDQFTAVGTDTRASLNQKLFIALQGGNYDAHDYLTQAVEAGAQGLLIDRWKGEWAPLKNQVSIIQVENTLSALQSLGQWRRQQWGKTIIAVTGSNGKTTTKEFIAQIISRYKKIHFNQGSFNNHWGLPLTLLGLQNEHEIAICEMGMNHQGEITALVNLAQPDIVGVTMIGRAHLEGLGSIQAVAEAKAEIYKINEPNSIKKRIFNMDNEWTKALFDRLSPEESVSALTFSAKRNLCDVHFKIDKMNLEGLTISGIIQKIPGTARISVFGQQNIDNLMFAACAALAVGLQPHQIWEALPHCQTIWGRNQRILHSSGTEFLFDGYNANPDSQKALIDNLKLIDHERPLIGIFGEMRELGQEAPKLHEELGALVATVPFHSVFFIGHHGSSFKAGFEKVSQQQNKKEKPLFIFSEINEELIQKIQPLLNFKPLISIKGSRGVGLEKILTILDKKTP